MEEIVSDVRLNSSLWRAALVGVVSMYFSCFGATKGFMSLEPKTVFADRPDALAFFRYWQSLRNKHLIHNESDMSSTLTGVVLGPGAHVQDILSIVTVGDWEGDLNALVGFRELILFTGKHVENAISEALPSVFAEVRAMTVKARMELPQLAISAPSSSHLRRT